MASTILPNSACTVLPRNPTDGQPFIDSEFVRWTYSAKLDLWERAGTVDSIPLATTEMDGLMSAADKRLLDKTPTIGGSFGIVVDSKLALQTATNPEGVVQGDIQLKSDSLDITCIGTDGEKLKCALPADLECVSDTGTPPGLEFKLKELFLETLFVDLNGPKGKKGDKGDKGDTGRHGLSDGPKGNEGLKGDNIDQLCELTDVVYNDIDGIAQEAIVNLELIDDNGHGCKLIVTKSKLNFPEDDPAERIIATSISRSVVYPEDPDVDNCDITRLADYELAQGVGDTTPLDIQLLRLPKGSNDRENEPLGFNATMNLSGFVDDVVAEYQDRLVKLDESWGKQVKTYIESIDDKARSILSGLADQLAQCEFNLPAVEYCVTYTPCGTPPPSPTPIASAGPNQPVPIQLGGRPSGKPVQMGVRNWKVSS